MLKCSCFLPLIQEIILISRTKQTRFDFYSLFMWLTKDSIIFLQNIQQNSVEIEHFVKLRCSVIYVTVLHVPIQLRNAASDTRQGRRISQLRRSGDEFPRRAHHEETANQSTFVYKVLFAYKRLQKIFQLNNL